MRSIAAPMQNEIKYSIEDKYIFNKKQQQQQQLM